MNTKPPPLDRETLEEHYVTPWVDRMPPKKRTCADRRRYERIVALRQWRDSFMVTENAGRARRIVSEYCSRISVTSGGYCRATCDITAYDGADFFASESWEIDAVKKAGLRLYRYLRKGL